MSRKVFDMGRNSHTTDAFAYNLGSINLLHISEGVMPYKRKTMAEILAALEAGQDGIFKASIEKEIEEQKAMKEAQEMRDQDRAIIEKQKADYERSVREEMERRMWEAEKAKADQAQRLPYPFPYNGDPRDYGRERSRTRREIEQYEYELWLRRQEEEKRRALMDSPWRPPPAPTRIQEPTPAPAKKKMLPVPGKRAIKWK